MLEQQYKLYDIIFFFYFNLEYRHNNQSTKNNKSSLKTC